MLQNLESWVKIIFAPQNQVLKSLCNHLRIAIVFPIFYNFKSFFFDSIDPSQQYNKIQWLFNNLDLDYYMQNNMSEKKHNSNNFLMTLLSNYHLNVMYHTIFVFVQLYCRCILSDLPTTQIINKKTNMSIF